MWLLWSRRFVRHQDRQNRHMSYIDVICVIWHQMTRMTSNDAYDINIWHQSIWPILVSKEAFGPQQSHLWIRFWITNCIKVQKLKSRFGIFFLYKFWKSFVFYAKTLGQIPVGEKCIKSILVFFYLFTHGSKKTPLSGHFLSPKVAIFSAP